MALSVYVITNASTDTNTKALIKLLDSPVRDDYTPLVICFAPLNTALKRQFEQIGIPVCVIERDQPRKAYIVISQLLKHWRTTPPKVIQGWDYAGNILATVLWRLSGRKAHLMWALTNKEPPKPTHWKAKLLLKLNKWWSKKPQKLLFQNVDSLVRHEELGYYTQNAKVLTEQPISIPELYPLQYQTQRQSLLAKLSLPDDTFLVGCVARFEESFDFKTLLYAALLASLHYPTMRWVWAGKDLDYGNRALYAQIKNFGLEQHVFLLGDTTEESLNELVAALDLATLASRNDALSPFLIKAMAYAVPVVATELRTLNPLANVTLVPHAQPQPFSLAWGEYYHMSHTARRACGLRARQQVLERYTQQTMVNTYQALFNKLTAG